MNLKKLLFLNKIFLNYSLETLLKKMINMTFFIFANLQSEKRVPKLLKIKNKSHIV